MLYLTVSSRRGNHPQGLHGWRAAAKGFRQALAKAEYVFDLRVTVRSLTGYRQVIKPKMPPCRDLLEVAGHLLKLIPAKILQRQCDMRMPGLNGVKRGRLTRQR